MLWALSLAGLLASGKGVGWAGGAGGGPGRGRGKRNLGPGRAAHLFLCPFPKGPGRSPMALSPENPVSQGNGTQAGMLRGPESPRTV